MFGWDLSCRSSWTWGCKWTRLSSFVALVSGTLKTLLFSTKGKDSTWSSLWSSLKIKCSNWRHHSKLSPLHLQSNSLTKHRLQENWFVKLSTLNLKTACFFSKSLHNKVKVSSLLKRKKWFLRSWLGLWVSRNRKQTTNNSSISRPMRWKLWCGWRKRLWELMTAFSYSDMC